MLGAGGGTGGECDVEAASWGRNMDRFGGGAEGVAVAEGGMVAGVVEECWGG